MDLGLDGKVAIVTAGERHHIRHRRSQDARVAGTSVAAANNAAVAFSTSS